MFRDETERLRAREAHVFVMMADECNTLSERYHIEEFDASFPPVVDASAPKIDGLPGGFVQRYDHQASHGYEDFSAMAPNPDGEYCRVADIAPLTTTDAPHSIGFVGHAPTPSPAFAAAAEALDRSVIKCINATLPTGDPMWANEQYKKARAALVRVHLEEVERGRHG